MGSRGPKKISPVYKRIFWWVLNVTVPFTFSLLTHSKFSTICFCSHNHTLVSLMTVVALQQMPEWYATHELKFLSERQTSSWPSSPGRAPGIYTLYTLIHLSLTGGDEVSVQRPRQNPYTTTQSQVVFIRSRHALAPPRSIRRAPTVSRLWAVMRQPVPPDQQWRN